MASVSEKSYFSNGSRWNWLELILQSWIPLLTHSAFWGKWLVLRGDTRNNVREIPNGQARPRGSRCRQGAAAERRNRLELMGPLAESLNDNFWSTSLIDKSSPGPPKKADGPME